MSRWSKSLFFASLLTGCLSGFHVAKAPAATPQFRPEQFFAGATHGNGVLAVRGRSDRPFRVTGNGRSEKDGTFVLDQTIKYSDGGSDMRSFRMKRVNARDYAGTLSGVAGPVSARVEGNSFHIRYTIRKPAVTMEQWIYLKPDGRTALNRATVRVLGIPVAHLSETITKS